MKASQVISKLERIRDKHPEASVRARASHLITEVMEDIIDHGQDFDIGAP